MKALDCIMHAAYYIKYKHIYIIIHTAQTARCRIQDWICSQAVCKSQGAGSQHSLKTKYVTLLLSLSLSLSLSYFK